MKNIYAIDVSRFMANRKTEIYSLLNDATIDTIIILFDETIIEPCDYDFEDLTFDKECAYYNCISKILLNYAPRKGDKLSLTIVSAGRNSYGTMLSRNSFENFLSHMLFNYSITIKEDRFFVKRSLSPFLNPYQKSKHFSILSRIKDIFDENDYLGFYDED